MVLSATYFSALLQALSLSQGFYNPSTASSWSSQSPHLGGQAGTVPTSSGVSSQSNAGKAVDAQNPLSGPVQPAYKQTEENACNVQYYQPPAVGDQTFPPFDQAKATVYRYRQQQSVNLGSWFVHENWMTPSMFTCASGQQLSELDIASGWNSTTSARAVLERHWDTFINQSDFEYLASIGINTVRLPIGYWSLGPEFCQGTPYENVSDVYQNSWVRVARAINMAGEAGIGVLVDLHGAPGSQNGQPHSGISDGITGLFDSPTYMNMTINVLTYLMQQLSNVSNVIGIEILNEPQDVPGLPSFYTQAISTMRQVSPTFPLYLHDGFNLDQFSAYVANRTDFVVVDHHSYFVFTPSDDAEPASQHTADVEGSIAESMGAAAIQARRNLVIDEWSCTLTPESLANETDPNQARKDFCTGQMDMYTNATAGWGFWAYDKEDCYDDLGWCFKAAVGNSLPSTFFSYGQGPITDPAQLPSLADLMGDMNAPSTSVILASAQSTPTDTGTFYPVDGPSPTSSAQHRRDWSGKRARATAGRRGRRDVLSLMRAHQRRQYDGATGMSPEQRSIARGYSDGFLTAKIFAQYGMSKLGFTGQYIGDSIAKLGPSVVKTGTEGEYEEWFMKGLQDGENIVVSHVGQGTS